MTDPQWTILKLLRWTADYFRDKGVSEPRASAEVLLAHALSWAEVLGAFDLYIGVNAVDYSGYPDCRPEFVAAFEALANVATAAAVEGRGRFTLHAPLLHLTKAEIIRRAVDLGVDLSLTHSCYDPVGELACGACDACVLRRAGFAAAGVPDPTRYHAGATARGVEANA